MQQPQRRHMLHVCAENHEARASLSLTEAHLCETWG